jgi:hypothetical protein
MRIRPLEIMVVIVLLLSAMGRADTNPLLDLRDLSPCSLKVEKIGKMFLFTLSKNGHEDMVVSLDRDEVKKLWSTYLEAKKRSIEQVREGRTPYPLLHKNERSLSLQSSRFGIFSSVDIKIGKSEADTLSFRVQTQSRRRTAYWVDDSLKTDMETFEKAMTRIVRVR